MIDVKTKASVEVRINQDQGEECERKDKVKVQ